MTGRPSLNLLVAITANALLGRGHVGDGVADIPTPGGPVAAVPTPGGPVAAVPTPGGPVAAVPVLAGPVAATGYRGFTEAMNL